MSTENLSLPGWAVKALRGCVSTAPYIFRANSVFALDNLGDLAAWCHENGSPASRVSNTANGRYLKIADPLCRKLELAGLAKN